jgi:hypothetical protein
MQSYMMTQPILNVIGTRLQIDFLKALDDGRSGGIQLCNNFGGAKCLLGAIGKCRRSVCGLPLWPLGD